MKTLIIWVGILFFAAILNAAVPYAGLKAEMDGKWEDAASLYESILKQDPSRIDLTLRLSDIYSKLQEYDKAATSLKSAIQQNPNDAQLYAKIATVYAVNKQPEQAMEAIKKAISLAPQNMNYLRDQASLANWLGDYTLTVESYKKIFEHTNEETLLLQIARTNSWSGHLDLAVTNFQNYLESHPEDKNIYLDYAKAEIWRGNYPKAEELLDIYVQKFSNDDVSQTMYADLYARAEWPNASQELYEPLLEKSPDDYMLNYIKTLALDHDKKVDESMQSLDKVTKMKPESKDTLDLNKVVLTKYRSNIRASGIYYQDIDNIRHTETSLYGEYYITPSTSVYAGAIYDDHRAKDSSPYINIDGSNGIGITTVGLGLTHRLNQYLHTDIFVGKAKTVNKSITVGKLNIRADLGDKATLFLDASQDFYKISPRSVSLSVQRAHSGALLEYRPTLGDTILLQGEYEVFSGYNRKWGALVAPRHAVVRSENWGVDLGVKAWLFGFKKNLDQGYYDPELFESYMLTIHSVYRYSSETEFSLIGGVGAIKDDSMKSYQPGMNIDLLGTTGIYEDWKFQVRTGYMNNQRETWSEYYDAYYVGMSIMRRF
jgi:tetratricopeptide (TPR) repeat protein